MEKGIKQFGKIFFLSTGVMASAAMLTGCAEEVAALAGGSGDGTRVEVTASFLPLENAALTRAADGLDDAVSGFSLTTSENGASKVRVMVDENDGSYAAFDYGITGPTAIEAPATAPTFPRGENSVNVYGWYPAKSLENFSVAGDQSGEADYCLSDLLWANSKTCIREGTAVTPAALLFAHVMSKVKVSLALAEGVTVKTVKLKNVKPTVTVTETKPDKAVTGYSLGNASGDAGDITLLSGGSLTSTSAAADKVLCGVFPPQSITGALLEITANYNDGIDQTITYSLEDAKTFATNKEYTIIIPLNPTDIQTGTVTLSDWGAETGEINVETGAAPTLDTSSVSIYEGASVDVTASVVGTAWAGISQDTDIATVETTAEGKIRITGVSEGTTNVYIIPTAGVTGGSSSAVCKVTVVSDPGIPLSEATTGMFVGQNGKAYQTKALANQYSSAQAWIAYKSATAGKSLAFALTDDATSGTSWNAFNSSPGWSSIPTRAAIDGRTWRWPTETDFDNMVEAFQDLPTTGNGVTPDGYSNYWSSTEYVGGTAYYLFFNGSGSSVSFGMKGSGTKCYVRAVLAF